MNQSEQVLYQFVLNTIADDDESVESVWEHVVKWASKRSLTLGRDSVVETLERAIREGDAKSYLLSPQPPRSQSVDFSPDRTDDLWFYVTAKGKVKIAG